MLIAHGGWVAGRLALWAEDPALPTTTTSRARLRPHPFAAPAAAVTTVLGAGDDSGRDALAKAESAELTFRLPGTARGPLPSPETGSDAPGHGLRLGEWTVPVLLIEPAQALTALSVLAEPDADAGWSAGASLRYLAVLAGHACDLARRGRMLPQLVAGGGGWAARWRPVLTGTDVATFRDFAAAMPPVCRAAVPPAPRVPAADEGLGAPAGGVAATLRDALESLVDAAVRVLLPERLLLGHRPGPKAPLPDRWVVALTAGDPSLPGARSAEAKALAADLSAWLTAAHEANAPIRVSFRLMEPPEGSEEWALEFALQSAEDPSLYVPAAAVWAGEQVPGLPPRPDETLLAGLGRAVRLYPAVHEALSGRHPAGLTLQTRDAQDFLQNAAPLLQAAGFGVQLPAWAGRKAVGLKLTTRSRPSGPGGVVSGGVGLDDLVDFRLDLVIGDHTVTAGELAELARMKVPLVRVRGRWVELDDRQLAAALRVVSRPREDTATAGELLQRVVDGGEDDLPLVEVDADGLLGDLLEGDRLAPVPTPPDFDGTLRPYQERGLSWLSFLSRLGLGGILADDMGLGKTAQTLALLLSAPGPSLLICPMSLLSNWRKEAARFAPGLRVYVHHGGARRRADVAADADLVVTTYGTALRDLGLLREVQWARVVCDEAQAIKNAATRQAQAVRAIPARTRLALTGTPVENHLAELWSIMEFCNPGLLGPAATFRKRYQEPIEVRRDAAATEALKRATGPFVLRRLKTDKSIISDLPEKNEMKTWCTLTPEQASLYAAVVEDMMEVIERSDGIQRRGNVIAAMTKLKQVCNHPAHLLKDGSRLPGRSGKLARLEELAEEIVAEGDKALVFTQYAEFGTMLQPYLAAHLDRPVLWLHGGLSAAKRTALVEEFQSSTEPTLFLLSLKAAGTGLNLTAANHVVHVDRWWNPAVEDQATDRAFRIGQRRDVQVRKFICTGTLEERIDEMIERKKALASSVVGTGEDWISDLTTDQLRELFTLDPAAVA